MLPPCRMKLQDMPTEFSSDLVTIPGQRFWLITGRDIQQKYTHRKFVHYSAFPKSDVI